MTREQLIEALTDAAILENIECKLSTHVLGSMAGSANLVTEQVLMRPSIVGPDNQHEAIVVRAELASRATSVSPPISNSTAQVASTIVENLEAMRQAAQQDEQTQKKRRKEEAGAASSSHQDSPSHDAGQEDTKHADDQQEALEKAAKMKALEARLATLDARQKAAADEQRRIEAWRCSE